MDASPTFTSAWFDYDRDAPLDIRTEAPPVLDASGPRIEDITYASPLAGRVTAYLVVPPGDGPFPAVLWMHAGQFDRRQFLVEATGLATRGVLSLLVESPYSRSDPGGEADASLVDPPSEDALEHDLLYGVTDPEEAVRVAAVDIQTVVDLRRGLDLLEARPDVDASRIGYVGHSYGAYIGALLLSFDAWRVRAAVLMAGHPAASELWATSPTLAPIRESMSPEAVDAYVRALQPLDAERHLGGVASPVLLQWAEHDRFITREDAARFRAAITAPVEEAWIATDHFFDEQARLDRDVWLARMLAG